MKNPKKSDTTHHQPIWFSRFHFEDMANPSFISRPSETQLVRLRIHHRGRFVDNPVKLYVGELVNEMDWDWDVDFLSYMQIEDLIKAQGYFNIKCLWYWNPNFSFSRGLRPLNNDSDVLRFVEDVRGVKLVDIYVEHKVEEVSIDDLIFEEEENVEVTNEEAAIEEGNVEVTNEEAAIEEENVEVTNEEAAIEEENVDVEVTTEATNEEENVEVREEFSEESNEAVTCEEVTEETNEAECWIATWHADDDFAIFGVSNGVETYSVNLLQKKCGCRRWNLTGIPCCHAISCIWFAKKEPEEFVSSFYRKSTVLATYSHIIMPTNGPQLWPVNVTHPINPPFMRRSIGRPKKNRNKANDEPRTRNTLPRSLQTVKCKKCSSFGHNKQTCKGKRAAEREIPKGGNKKAKKKVGKSLKVGEQTVIEGESQAPPPTQE